MLVMRALLDSSRLLDGEASISLHYEEFDVAALLREVSQLHRDTAPRVEIRESLPNTPLLAVGDRNLLFQAFSNLLSNAIKYSPDGDVVTITAAGDADEIAVTVADSGIGIRDDEKAHLFERYYRGSNVSGTVGTGIGLYLVKLVVELHQGSISVQSREGEGSAFTVRLPLCAGAAAPAVELAATASSDA
jgi:two-component system, OmpR family, sensor kinase